MAGGIALLDPILSFPMPLRADLIQAVVDANKWFEAINNRLSTTAFGKTMAGNKGWRGNERLSQ
jgi:hypothetical protein